MPSIRYSISFALVNIPVTLTPVIKNNDTSFNQLHKKCLKRIRYIKYCPHCKKDLKESDIVKGYEFDRDAYLVFSKSELDAIKPENAKEIEVVSFIKEREIPSYYFQKSYFLSTENKSKAYTLFYEALKKSKKVALAKCILNNKFYYCILKLVESGIILTTIYFAEEVKLKEAPLTNAITTKEINLALKLIESMTARFEPTKYHDEYQRSIQKAIDTKLKGTTIRKKKTTSKKQVTDLMKALESSLKSTK